MSEAIVIVGGGHAGVQLCSALAAAGLGAQTTLVCAEPVLPYQRPPLSKAFLKQQDDALQAHRSAGWFAEQGITVHLGDAAVAIDRAAQQLQLASGARLPYGQLVLATGARARALPPLHPGLANVHVLRNASDATRLRATLPAMQRLTVLGGGFIGLEVAATAAALGKAVQVLEAAPRLMQRSVSPVLSAHVQDGHRAAGIDLRLGATVAGIELQGDRLVALQVNGERQAIDTLLLGVGAEPETTLAAAAGLACDNGIVVDTMLRTSDPHILAVGDCCNFPLPGSGPVPTRLRLESVQNANDQAKWALATLTGAPPPAAPVPWFWSEQGAIRLQMAGLAPAGADLHRRPGATPASFSVLHYACGRLACVESVNAPMDHLAARRLLELGLSPDPAAACDSARPLKSFIPLA
ncbi:MAG: FAD-dependent oxidoreductase [Rubrivivax sp.]|nr:FAD-dependent oxidoreductase [Rubrivivax sp.]